MGAFRFKWILCESHCWKGPVVCCKLQALPTRTFEMAPSGDCEIKRHHHLMNCNSHVVMEALHYYKWRGFFKLACEDPPETILASLVKIMESFFSLTAKRRLLHLPLSSSFVRSTQWSPLPYFFPFPEAIRHPRCRRGPISLS